ncbi:MAG: prepilin peptidase [Candidatus Aminicenantes bacterium]|nr:MAG: prepilin peptidase [Candidatus Aminicenantes bacterium]
MEEIVLVILGLIIGSFLNVVIYRLPLEKSIIKPGSHCPSCNTPVKFYDNIPVISYILLKGKCRHCKANISLIYPFVESFTAFSFWLAYVYFGQVPLYMGFSILFICLLLSLALIDLKHMILPLGMSVGGGAVFLVYSFFNPFISPVNAFLSAAGAALAFAAIYYFYLKVRKIEGLGQGDIWMMLLLGSFLGLNKLVIAILLASLSGVIVGMFFIIFKKKNLKLALPFGTFLSLGSYISLFWGNDILRLIQSFYR